MATSHDRTTVSPYYRVRVFSPHTHPKPGLLPFVRRLRHSLARRRAGARVRLEQHRTEHPAGRQPARERLTPLSEAELVALNRFRQLSRAEKRLLLLGLRHRALAPFLVRLLIASRVTRRGPVDESDETY